MDFDDVFIVDDIIPLHLSARRKHGAAPDAGVFEIRGHVAMDKLGDFEQRPAALQREGLVVVRFLLRWQLRAASSALTGPTTFEMC